MGQSAAFELGSRHDGVERIGPGGRRQEQPLGVAGVPHLFVAGGRRFEAARVVEQATGPQQVADAVAIGPGAKARVHARQVRQLVEIGLVEQAGHRQRVALGRLGGG